MSRKKYFLIALSVIIAALIIIAIIIANNQKEEKVLEEKQDNETEQEESIVTTGENITLPNTTVQANNIGREELIKHNNKNDCWVSYENKVYDVTAFLPQHPGSASAIIPYCGTQEEFSRAFKAQHGRTKEDMLADMGTFKGMLE
jgi:cytochrome b involved in lipid metabolism